ncbi:MAG: hypothetical protein R3Y04_04650 [Rikenellaceae bacterium]
MKKTILTAILMLLLGANQMLNAKNSNDITLDELLIVGLDVDSIYNSGVSLDDISKALGDEDVSLPESINELLVSLFSKEAGKTSILIANNIENAAQSKKHYVVVENYDVAKKGYPYDNYLHSLSYAVYDSDNQKIVDGKQQFATLDCIDRKQLEKQLSKVVKKVISKVS